MRFLPPLLFMLAALLAAELSFRVYLYGPGALNPVKMNSFNQIHHADLVTAAENPAINYELRPNQDVWYKGTKFRTNSAGLRDQEYSLKKPANTFRIAIVGSSWTMGSGVDIENVWHSKIEDRLNTEVTDQTVEVINFGVDQYGLGEIIATLENKVMAYEPDLIIVTVTVYTPTVLWTDDPEPYQPLQRRQPFFDSHMLRVLDHRFGFGIFYNLEGIRPQAQGKDEVSRQQERAAAELTRIAASTDVPVVIVKLAYVRGWKTQRELPRKSILANLQGIPYIDITDTVRSAGYKPRQLRVSVWDSHPNERAHGLIADSVYSALRDRGLLPLPENNEQSPDND